MMPTTCNNNGNNDNYVVLIVDDVPANLAMLSDTLDDSGHMVLVATDGASAIERLRHATPDIILMDAMMPGMDGFETCRRIKRMTQFSQIPIVFMTGLTETEHVLTGFQAGGIDYVTKPIQPLEIVVRIDTHIRNARLLSQARRTIVALTPTRPAAIPRAGGMAACNLTPRESDVLAWLAKGKTNRDIAEILGMSPRTVNKHLEHIFIKLGVETRSAAAALSLGWLYGVTAALA